MLRPQCNAKQLESSKCQYWIKPNERNYAAMQIHWRDGNIHAYRLSPTSPRSASPKCGHVQNAENLFELPSVVLEQLRKKSCGKIADASSSATSNVLGTTCGTRNTSGFGKVLFFKYLLVSSLWRFPGRKPHAPNWAMLETSSFRIPS